MTKRDTIENIIHKTRGKMLKAGYQFAFCDTKPEPKGEARCVNSMVTTMLNATNEIGMEILTPFHTDKPTSLIPKDEYIDDATVTLRPDYLRNNLDILLASGDKATQIQYYSKRTPVFMKGDFLKVAIAPIVSETETTRSIGYKKDEKFVSRAKAMFESKVWDSHAEDGPIPEGSGIITGDYICMIIPKTDKARELLGSFKSNRARIPSGVTNEDESKTPRKSYYDTTYLKKIALIFDAFKNPCETAKFGWVTIGFISEGVMELTNGEITVLIASKVKA